MSTDTRIESLENQVRTLKRMLLGVFGLVVVGGLLAATSLQSVPDVIQAKKFEVVNDEGAVTVKLESYKGSGVIVSTDKNGAITFFVINETDEEGLSKGTLSTLNSKGQTLVKLGAGPSGGMVTIANDKGATLVGLVAGSSGGMVGTFDKEGKELTSRTP